MAAVAYQSALDFDDPASHYQLLHHNPHGAVVVWEQRKTGNAWHKIEKDQPASEIQTLLSGLAGKQDTFFSVNEFNGWRITRLLKSLRANYVDIDLGRAADRGDLDEALDTLAVAGMPWPSLAVFSGRGLHLYWCTTHTPARVLPVWQAVQKQLIQSLSAIGADPKARDCARVLRLVGTVNSKVNSEVRGLVLDGIPWKFHGLADEVLGERSDGRKKAQVHSLFVGQIRAGIHPKATTFRRWHLVFQYLGKIGEHHRCVPAGHRNEFLFVTSVALSWFAAPESIEDEVVDFARLYCPDVSADEARKAASQSVARATRAAGGSKVMFAGQERDPRYVFKRSTLWQRLGELADPVKHRLRAIIPDELANERKSERDAARWEDHYTREGVRASNEAKRATARLLNAQGHSIRAVAAQVGVSAMTVSRWLRV
jgi:hypothetical protein